MLKSILRWCIILLTLLAVGPLLASLFRTLHDRDGGHAFTLLISDSPVKGIGYALALLAAATIIGGITSAFFSLNSGLACIGLLFGWSAWQLGTIDGIIRRFASSGVAGGGGGGSDLLILALEAFLTCLAAAAIVHFCSLLAEKNQPRLPNHTPIPRPKGLRGVLFTDLPAPHDGSIAGPLIGSILAAMIAGGFMTALVAVTGLKGQTLFATFIGGIAAGLAASHMARTFKASVSVVTPILAMGLLGLLAPIIAKFMHGGGGASIVDILNADKLFPLARPISLDWATGALLGVPIGMSWAGVILDTRAVEQPVANT